MDQIAKQWDGSQVYAKLKCMVCALVLFVGLCNFRYICLLVPFVGSCNLKMYARWFRLQVSEVLECVVVLFVGLCNFENRQLTFQNVCVLVPVVGFCNFKSKQLTFQNACMLVPFRRFMQFQEYVHVGSVDRFTQFKKF